jgi:hypothetical protein
MIAHFIAHLIAQEKNPIAALRHLHQDLTIALIIPKIAGTMVTKVKVLIKDCILHMSYMSIKYQNYILNVIYGFGY